MLSDEEGAEGCGAYRGGFKSTTVVPSDCSKFLEALLCEKREVTMRWSGETARATEDLGRAGEVLRGWDGCYWSDPRYLCSRKLRLMRKWEGKRRKRKRAKIHRLLFPSRKCSETKQDICRRLGQLARFVLEAVPPFVFFSSPDSSPQAVHF
jgi:hypothetical protein